MMERLTIQLDPRVAAQLRDIASDGGESVESLIGRLVEVAATMIGDEAPRSELTEEQLADLRERLKNPGPFATDAEADAFFARFGA